MSNEQSLQSLAGMHAEKWENTALQLQADAATLDRWILAACLSINGGGALATLSLESISRTSKLVSGASFSLGIVLCILFAITYARLMRSAQVQAEIATSILRRFESGEISNVDDLQNAGGDLAKLERSEKLAYLFSYGSLSLFGFGVIVLGIFGE